MTNINHTTPFEVIDGRADKGPQEGVNFPVYVMDNWLNLIGLRGFSTYLHLIHFAARNDEKGLSLHEVAKKARTSLSKAVETLNALEEIGFIAVERENGAIAKVTVIDPAEQPTLEQIKKYAKGGDPANYKTLTERFS